MKKGFKILPSSPYDDKDQTYKKYYSSWREFNKGNNDSKETFAMIFTSFKENHLSKIEGGALKLYLFFCFNSNNTDGDSWYSIEKIADFFKVGTRTVDKWVKILVDRQLIYREQATHKSATTYLLPYSTTLMKAQTTGSYPDDSQEIIEDITNSLKKQKQIFGNVIGVFHLFQWKISKSKKRLRTNTQNIQWILFITRRENGVLTGHYYELKASEDIVVSKRSIEETYFFTSPYTYDGNALLGIALDNENEIDITSNTYEPRKQLIEQLAIIDKSTLDPKYFIDYQEIEETNSEIEES
ncbi:helix-turn-helix domain-containing protein [Neobacillus jeddahensis]|uniref:helix-turn-helix domain-containing protein n=1 Tax=Neobacillus jeddahensis TaxID=1461580 RepID=UPI0005A877D2|nr:hypothetical protein [Neobacillus jeddahensis]